MIIKSIALVLIVALIVIGIAVSHFISSGMTVNVKSNLEVHIGVDHEPAPTINYHIKKEGVWGL